MHKRRKRKGKSVALCGDGRAKRLHNWWDAVDCDVCWRSRLPLKHEKCEVEGCRRPAAHWVDRAGLCTEHTMEAKTKGTE